MVVMSTVTQQRSRHGGQAMPSLVHSAAFLSPRLLAACHEISRTGNGGTPRQPASVQHVQRSMSSSTHAPCSPDGLALVKWQEVEGTMAGGPAAGGLCGTSDFNQARGAFNIPNKRLRFLAETPDIQQI